MKKTWMGIAAIAVAFIIVATIFSHNSRVLADIYNPIIVGLPSAALLFIIIYTVLAFKGAAKWWQWNIGTNLVTLAFTILLAESMLAWAALFNHGSLTTSLEAWIYVGGKLGGLLVMVWRCLIWLSNPDSNGNGIRTAAESPGEPEAVPTAEPG